MLTVYDCIVFNHDPRLVLLAAIICMVASFAAIHLLHHVNRSRGLMRNVWLCVAGVATGFGIWATHFIAMLAYSPGLQSGYNLVLTLASLIAAVLLTILGLFAASRASVKLSRLLGGVVVGSGIAVMHYTGMSAFEVPGRLIWNGPLVAASIAMGIVFAGAALPVGLRGRTYKSIAAGALLLTFAICGHHFTAMAAAALVLDSTVTVSPNAIPTQWLAVLVALACLTIFFLTFAGFALDMRERNHAKREAERLNNLANAAFEGLLICNGGEIATVNASLATMIGRNAADLTGCSLAQFLTDKAVLRWLEERPSEAIETLLQPHGGGAPIAVEVISRQVRYKQKLQKVVAIRDLRDRKKAEQDIYYLAHHDTLTGLANRNSFHQELNRLIKAHSSGGQYHDLHLAVLYLDLDRFKEVNDLFGHGAGDELLQAVAQCATKTLGRGQIMARLGGDEFAIIAPGLKEPEHAGRIAEGLLQAFQDENLRSTLASALISSSIGVAVFPNDAADGPSLMSCADTALYRAKAEGRGTYRFFEEAMGEQVRARREIEHRLRFAIERGELSLVYQPLTRLDNLETVGFEALARWRSGEEGEIPPSVFVPIAEECGLIRGIGEWVLSEACQEAATWRTPLSVSVNVSAVQLHSPGFVPATQRILETTGLPPNRLELEITETALIRDPARAQIALRQLKDLGIRIAMDDFGTGYSSLSNLREFPFDKIKIDQSFVRAVNSDEHAAAIVRAVLGLGRGLGLPVLAEGVETEEELAFLRNESCPEAQGYVFARPQPISAFRHLLYTSASAS